MWPIKILNPTCRSQDKSAILAIPSTLEELYEMYDLMNSSLPVATTMEEFEARDVKSDEEITFSILFKIVLVGRSLNGMALCSCYCLILRYNYLQKNRLQIG